MFGVNGDDHDPAAAARPDFHRKLAPRHREPDAGARAQHAPAACAQCRHGRVRPGAGDRDQRRKVAVPAPPRAPAACALACPLLTVSSPQAEKETAMIHSSTLLRRALLADAIFSGVSALAMTLDAGLLASLLQLPEALLRETGLFLIAYTARS